jgi:hypothetical protein
MARLNQGITSSGKGIVGNIIMYEMYGRSYLRSRPSAYKDKKSKSQLAQRQRLKLVQKILLCINPLLRITMKEIAIGRSAYHTALSLNVKQAIKGEYPDQFIDPEKVILSQGNLTVPEKVSATKTDEGILLEWSVEDARNGNNNPSDNLIWCMKDLDTFAFADYGITTAKRSGGKHIVPVPSINKPVDIWVIFRNERETEISNTKWVGRI